MDNSCFPCCLLLFVLLFSSWFPFYFAFLFLGFCWFVFCFFPCVCIFVVFVSSLLILVINNGLVSIKLRQNTDLSFQLLFNPYSLMIISDNPSFVDPDHIQKVYHCVTYCPTIGRRYDLQESLAGVSGRCPAKIFPTKQSIDIKWQNDALHPHHYWSIHPFSPQRGPLYVRFIYSETYFMHPFYP